MFSLAVASTTLIFGRLADMYSGRRIYICGSVWLAVWSLVIGFARNEILLDLSRAFQGIGASAMLPSGLMLMGRIYRPEKRKNMVFSIYGACAPFGLFSLFAEGSKAYRGKPYKQIISTNPTLFSASAARPRVPERSVYFVRPPIRQTAHCNKNNAAK
jgi:hypothetical protein